MYKIVLFEGLPGSGKSSVINELRRVLSGYPQPMWVDRGMYSAMVYDVLAGRDRSVDMQHFIDHMYQWIHTCYLQVDPVVALQRAELRDPKWKSYTIGQLEELDALYKSFLSRYPTHRVSHIDAGQSLPEVARSVIGVV